MITQILKTIKILIQLLLGMTYEDFKYFQTVFRTCHVEYVRTALVHGVYTEIMYTVTVEQ